MRNIYAKVCQGWDIICVLIIQWCLIIPERLMNVLAAKQMKPPLCFVLTQWRPLWEAPLQKITRKQQPSGKIDDRLVTWIAGLTHSRSHSVCTCQVSLNDTFTVNFPPEGQDYALYWSDFKYEYSSSIYPRDLAIQSLNIKILVTFWSWHCI